MAGKVILIHGPNLNLLGQREESIYGNVSSEDILESLRKEFPNTEITYFQSNHESELIDVIQKAAADQNGIIINGGAFAHTSIGMADALRSIRIPKINVHISNVKAREDYRQTDLLEAACTGSIVGLGVAGYALALDCLLDEMNQELSNRI